jgi:hypothetical protein
VTYAGVGDELAGTGVVDHLMDVDCDAIWWSDHPAVPREQIVTAAVNAIWIGFERVSRGESWPRLSVAASEDGR